MTFPYYPKSREIYSHTGLRGIAAMVVVLRHIYDPRDDGIFRFINWAGYAVDLFFILSGFILNWVYLQQSKSLNWASYFCARFARIVPLYILTTLLFIPPANIYSMIKHGATYVGKDYIVTIFCNLFIISGIINGSHKTLNYPAWSISVEVFCYIFVFPLLIMVWTALSKKRFFLGASVFLVIVLTILLVMCYRQQPFYILHAYWDSSWLARGIFGFSIGFILCSIYRESLIATWKPSIGIINMTILGCIIVFVLTRVGFMEGHTLLYSLPILVFFTAYDEGFFANFLKLPIIQWLGDRSYSVYLWHAILIYNIELFYRPIFAKANVNPPYGMTYLILVLGFVLLISDISYRFFEVPCRDYIRILGKKKFGYCMK